MRVPITLSILCLYPPFRTVEAFKGHLPVKKDPCLTSTRLFERVSFVPDLPNPFAGIKVPSFVTSSALNDDEPFEPSPEGLVRQAKRVLASDLGLLYPSLLDEDFEWIGPTVDLPLKKTDYLAAGRFFDLRSTFPDLNYRAHDFRIDPNDDATVRLTCRTVGTMRGELRLRDGTLSPTGNTMRCPPEAVSMTFDKQTGKLVKLCTGFVLDRLAGNTRGLVGVRAASVTAGKPVSEWEIYPPVTIVKRFFARPDEPIPEATNFLAPFPETVMIQLAKGVVSSNMAEEDPTLLSNDFTYCTPSIGPIGKTKFIKQFAAQEFEGVNPNFSNFRVDPYGPERVWVDLQPTGPGYEGAPQAMSFTFDENGFCTRVTSRAVMDPTIGNGGGLGGPEGVKFAMGGGVSELASRPLPRILGRLKVQLLDSLPGSKSKEKQRPQVALPKPLVQPERVTSSKAPPAVKPSKEREKLPAPLQKLSSSFGTVNLLKMKEEAASRKESEAKREKSPPPLQKLSESLGSINLLDMQKSAASLPVNGSSSQRVTGKATQKQRDAARAKALQERQVAAKKAKAEKKRRDAEAEKKRRDAETARAKALQERQRAARKEGEEKKRKAAQAKGALQERQLASKKAKEANKRREAEKAAQARAQQEREAAKKKAAQAKATQEQAAKKAGAERARRDAEKRRKAEAAKKQREAETRAAMQKTGAEEEKRLAQQKQREQAALKTLAKAPFRATIQLLGLGGSDDEDEDKTVSTSASRPVTTAPRGVPTISRWRKNLDGSVSGLVSGSKSFEDGERITTSPIAKGTLASGEVVTTGSGSRYFLR